MSRKIIIDVDTGVDDAQAIMLALSRSDIEVLAITCVAGNVHVNIDQVCLNTLKVLKVCKRLDIPVYKGAAGALTSDGSSGGRSLGHGSDGLGDTDLQVDVDLSLIKPDDAATALTGLVHKHPGEITLVALAPLTNIAQAMKLDSDFGKKLKNVTIMGGNIEGKGSTNYVCAEYNFGSDTEAAQFVLNGLGVPITIFPWEINLSELAGQPWEWYDTWTQTDSDRGQFLKAISQKAAHTQREVKKMPLFRSCDMSAMATVVDPSIVLESVDVYATVEVKGQFTRGMMVVDWLGILEKNKNVTVVKKIDTSRARKLFEDILMD